MESTDLRIRQSFFIVVCVVVAGCLFLIYTDTLNVRVDILLKPALLVKFRNVSWDINTILRLNRKKIFASSLWHDPDYINSFFSNCSVECDIVTDVKQINECQALIYDQAFLPTILPVRMPGQIWIYLTHEPPQLSATINGSAWQKAFNWTMSCRRDSEVQFPWGMLLKRTKPLVRDYEKIFHNKTGHISWLVSNCKTPGKRELYIERMRNYTTVDQIGLCGGTICPRERTEKCRRELGWSHKFFLAFENSVCRDYTSEKAWLLYNYNLPIIPVTRGSPNVSSQLPKGTYVSALDFASAEDLAEYLNELGNDKQRYIKMLKEKDKYTAISQYEVFDKALCSVCERITRGNIKTTQLDIIDWLNKADCVEPDL